MIAKFFVGLLFALGDSLILLSGRGLCVIGGRLIFDPAWFEGGTTPVVFWEEGYRGRS